MLMQEQVSVLTKVQEYGFRITRLADNFENFIRRLYE